MAILKEMLSGLLCNLALGKSYPDLGESLDLYQTTRHQTKGIRTLCQKCHTQEVFKGSHLNGKIEGSQTGVYTELNYNFTTLHIHSPAVYTASNPVPIAKKQGIVLYSSDCAVCPTPTPHWIETWWETMTFVRYN